jgi:hypothetical protein
VSLKFGQILGKLPKSEQSPNGRKFARSGHPACHALIFFSPKKCEIMKINVSSYRRNFVSNAFKSFFSFFLGSRF